MQNPDVLENKLVTIRVALYVTANPIQTQPAFTNPCDPVNANTIPTPMNAIVAIIRTVGPEIQPNSLLRVLSQGASLPPVLADKKAKVINRK
jgi:hypothetical protein